MSILKPPSWYRQSGVVALRFRNRAPQVLLVTSNGGNRWVIPKGIVDKGHSPASSAAKEAWEEAGVRGIVSRRMLGRYVYEKWGGFCTVQVYLLLVTAVARTWPEGHVRLRRWHSPAAAAALMPEPELREIILAASVAARRQAKGIGRTGKGGAG